jgi:hypothetical protein
MVGTKINSLTNKEVGANKINKKVGASKISKVAGVNSKVGTNKVVIKVGVDNKEGDGVNKILVIKVLVEIQEGVDGKDKL